MAFCFLLVLCVVVLLRSLRLHGCFCTIYLHWLDGRFAGFLGSKLLLFGLLLLDGHCKLSGKVLGSDVIITLVLAFLGLQAHLLANLIEFLGRHVRALLLPVVDEGGHHLRVAFSVGDSWLFMGGLQERRDAFFRGGNHRKCIDVLIACLVEGVPVAIDIVLVHLLLGNGLDAFAFFFDWILGPEFSLRVFASHHLRLISLPREHVTDNFVRLLQW